MRAVVHALASLATAVNESNEYSRARHSRRVSFPNAVINIFCSVTVNKYIRISLTQQKDFLIFPSSALVAKSMRLRDLSTEKRATELESRLTNVEEWAECYVTNGEDRGSAFL